MIIIIFKKYSRPAVTSTHCFVQVNIVLYHIVYRFLTVMRLLLHCQFFGIIPYFDILSAILGQSVLYFILFLISSYNTETTEFINV